MSNLQEEISYIARRVEQSACFALLRRPGIQSYEILLGGDCPQKFTSLDEIGGLHGWLAVPFNPSSDAPILHFFPSSVESRPVIPLQKFAENSAVASAMQSDEEEKADYRGGFDHCLGRLRDGEVRKVVYARRERFELAVKADAAFCISLFLRECALQRQSYVSLWRCGDSDFWLVSTPEVLLSGKSGEEFRTMALAGTMLWEEAAKPGCWSKKNREEQALVADYIKERLERLGCQPYLDGPYAARAGNVAHLRTDISFRMPQSCCPSQVVAGLHPTPAVCGLPSSEALAVIAEAEGFPRKYYAGFSGVYDFDGMTDLYVSLRCMELSAGVASLYAGGGLLAASVCEDEWIETCRKMRAMEQLLNHEQ